MNDLPLSGQSLTSMAGNRTGSWRSVEPFYQDRTAPCAHSCLAGEDVPLQIELVFERRYEEAIEVLRRANPFPAIVGRVCPAPCENSCLRRTLGGSISIRAMERFLGDTAIRRNLAPRPRAPRRNRVAVIGAGPAGLAAAYYLGMEGYRVTVFEEKPETGGLLRYGIPPFRLPRSVLNEELALVFSQLPVEFRCNLRVTHRKQDLLEGFETVILAAGKNVSADPGVEGSTPEMSGLKLLEALGRGERPSLSGVVAVIGGGSTAFDCARVALRLGARPTIYYRRSRGEMPAFAHDLAEAEEEQIPIVENVAPVRVEPGRVTMVRTRSSGRASRVEVLPDSKFGVDADHVFFATGETQEIVFPKLQQEGRAMPVDETGAGPGTNVLGAGDFTTAAPGTVSGAILQGRLVAATVHARLSRASGAAHRMLSHARGAAPDVVRLEELNLNYFETLPRIKGRHRAPAARTAGFLEVEGGLVERAAVHEAGRCMSCGTCVLCFNCQTYCADGAVRYEASSRSFSIDLDHCKGCLVCVAECPRHCMGSRYVTAGTADGE